jgi:hypothetical protein
MTPKTPVARCRPTHECYACKRRGFEARETPRPIFPLVDDYELIAQKLSALAEEMGGLSERVSRLDNRMADVPSRVSDAEKLNAHLEEAALATARALEGGLGSLGRDL